jgi:hypothetical protein
MQLREMRYAKIEGTEVLVQVNSPAEAKLAIKELKHKKKEIGLIRKRMVRHQVSAKRAHDREETRREQEARRTGVLATLRRVSRVFAKRLDLPDVDALAQDLEQTDEILHNIESCIIQLEGRLLA